MTEQDQTQADSLAAEGKSLYLAKKYPAAASTFKKAADLYQDSGDLVLSAEMRNNQSVALLMAKEPRQALDAVQGTSAIFLEVGKETAGAMALANEASARKELGESEAALDLFLRAADLFQQAGEEQLFLETMQSVSGLKMRSRNLTGALYAMQKGLDGIKKPSLRQRILKGLLKIPDQLQKK